MTKDTIVKRLLESNYITSEEADLLLNGANQKIEIEDKYVKKEEFVKAINEIKELVALIVPNSTSEKKHIQSLENKISKEDEKKQNKLLEIELANWMQKEEQVDDICIMGVRV